MALTQGAWTKTRIANFNVWECDVTATTAENDSYTLPLGGLDGSKKFSIFVNTAAADLDGTTVPVDVWGGTTVAGLTGDGATVAWTSGAGANLVNAAIADVDSLTGHYSFDPKLTAAAAPLPFYVVNLDGGSTLAAATCHFMIVQAD